VTSCSQPELTGGRCAAEFVCAVCLELTHMGPIEGLFARGQVEALEWLTGNPAVCASCQQRFTCETPPSDA
jgi:hypothetical protein